LARVQLLSKSSPTILKLTVLLGMPPTVTMTFPVVASGGTRTSMTESLQLVTNADLPLKVTRLDPCDCPKPDPKIVTLARSGPEVRDSLEMIAVSTVK
jgi:hypothetical protein